MSDPPSILVVEDDEASRDVIVQLLAQGGLPAFGVGDAEAALAAARASAPELFLVDLVLPGRDGLALTRALRADPALQSIPVVIMTGRDDPAALEAAFAAGADDHLQKPLRSSELLARVRAQLRDRAAVRALAARQRDLATVLELVQALASRLDIREILATLVTRLAEVARVDRCSIVLTGDRADRGFVVATSDDPRLRDLPIDLGKYPEIREALDRSVPVVIDDAVGHPLLDAVRSRDAAPSFASLALLPLIQDGRAFGVLFLRARKRVAFGRDELTLLEAVSTATAIALRNARLLQELRAETQESAVARAEAESRMRLFQRYRDFFESASDGIVVIDRSGTVLFANPSAREITGFSQTDLAAIRIAEVMSPEQQKRALRLVRGFREGIYPQGVDVPIRRKDGVTVTLSVNFSSVLREEDAVLFTFRDVTVERRTAIELRQTKEYFERVIESSVDAIVTAGLDGRVMLFNRAAARVFGYDPAEVIGTLSVERLYPPGVAREVMRKIRDPRTSGPGVLEDYRVDMVHSSGEVLPVKLSAALIMDGARAVGSVGIFTDIREKLRMEARLAKAQEELREREKQAAVAQLAGATAHELNQPLTSIIGYSQLIARRVEPEGPVRRAADVIVTQSERMAEIVRKIGKITRYETMSYVGGAKVVDLSRVTEDPDEKG